MTWSGIDDLDVGVGLDVGGGDRAGLWLDLDLTGRDRLRALGDDQDSSSGEKRCRWTVFDDSPFDGL
jgi:hypothetical protein